MNVLQSFTFFIMKLVDSLADVDVISSEVHETINLDVDKIVRDSQL